MQIAVAICTVAKEGHWESRVQNKLKAWGKLDFSCTTEGLELSLHFRCTFRVAFVIRSSISQNERGHHLHQQRTNAATTTSENCIFTTSIQADDAMHSNVFQSFASPDAQFSQFDNELQQVGK